MTQEMLQMTQYVILLGLTVLIWGLSAMMIVIVVTYIRDLFR